MASAAHTSLDAAATERKARLAKLASLKRKQPDSDTTTGELQKSTEKDIEALNSPAIDAYLSGRNYDPATRGPKLGFENVPSANVQTLEQQAEAIAAAAAEQATKGETEAEKGIDLFKLQPKKPNWDLKRDLAEKMKVLDVQTQNAIARLVRDRIERQKQEALDKQQGIGKMGLQGEQGEEVGIGGNELVEGVHLREEEERRERELDNDDALS